jgi:hypothetical protein
MNRLVEMILFFLNETNERNCLFMKLILQNTHLLTYKYKLNKECLSKVNKIRFVKKIILIDTVNHVYYKFHLA